MLDNQKTTATATSVAEAIYEWAKDAGALATGSQAAAAGDPDLLARLGLERTPKLNLAEPTLKRLRIIALTGDDSAGQVGVLLKNQVTPSAQKRLPTAVDGISIRYIGQATIEQLPPNVPHASPLGGPRFSMVNGRFACGSSIIAAPIASAGTLGALVRLGDGTLCGLSNNHVTGDCNHTQKDMYVLCPSPIDADPSLAPPTAIGRHHALVPLRSGDPGQIAKQEIDAAVFRIEDPNLVTSWQGHSLYDTPATTAPLSAMMKVKKFGRTTGLTVGRVVGPVLTPLEVPYQSTHFRSKVHFTGVWYVQSIGVDPFSEPGDSGSLVVTEDEKHAVGLLFGGSGPVGMIMPIDKVLQAFGGASLVSGHNV